MNTSDHILVDTQATLEITFSAGDAAGNVTYVVTDSEGAAVASGTANNETEAGRYTFVLAPQPMVANLVVAWTGTWGGVPQTLTTTAEIVGAYLFTLAEARAYDKAVLGNATVYSDAAIRAARVGITDFFQEITGVGFVPRYGRAVLDGDGGRELKVQDFGHVDELLYASVNGTALTAPELAEVSVYPEGRFYRPAGWPRSADGSRRNIVLGYEFGAHQAPWDVHEQALVLLRYTLVPSDISDRTITWTNELGTFRQAVPGEKYPTGLPSVDAMLSRYSHKPIIRSVALS